MQSGAEPYHIDRRGPSAVQSLAGTVAAAAVAPLFERVIILERDDIEINVQSLSRPQAQLNDMALVRVFAAKLATKE